MVELSATMDGAASRAFSAALKEYASSLGAGVATAPRRAAISICKTFRNNTRVAKKTRKVEAVPIGLLSSYGKYSTKWLADPYRRLVEIKFKDKPDLWGVYRYLKCKYPKHNGLQQEAKKMFGRNVMSGLAKHSWGWVMHNIFDGAAPDAPWRRRKKDKRDPKEATSESTSNEQQGETISSGYARICNRLDYIVAALRISPDEALRKAANKIMRPIINANLRKAGMSPSEIKHEGHRLHEEWLRQFAD